MAKQTRKRLWIVGVLVALLVVIMAGGVLVSQIVQGDHHARTLKVSASAQFGSFTFPSGVLKPITAASQFRLESYSPHGFTWVTADGLGNPYQGSSTPRRFIEMLTSVAPSPRTRTMQIGNSDNNITTTLHSPMRLHSADSTWDTDTLGDGLIIGMPGAFEGFGQIWRVIPEAQLDVTDPPKLKHKYTEITSAGRLHQYVPDGKWELDTGHAVTGGSFVLNSSLHDGHSQDFVFIVNGKFQALPTAGSCTGGTKAGHGCHDASDCPGGGTCGTIGAEAGIYEGYLEHRAVQTGTQVGDFNRWIAGFGTGVYQARMRTDGTNVFMEWGTASTMDVTLGRLAANELGLAAGDWLSAESVLITKATVPFTCAAAHDGRQYYDTTGNGALCLCVDDGTPAWEVVHGTGSCA